MSKYFFGKKRYTREKTGFFEFFARKTVNYYLFLKKIVVRDSIPNTDYFCGNKSVFAVLNEPLVRLTISVVCLAKTLRAEKSVFSDDFLRARTKLCFTHCKRALGKKG